MTLGITSRSGLRLVGVVAAWLGLGVFNGLALLAFGGWVGPADAFVLWSGAAGLVWLMTRIALEFPPLYRHWAGRVLIICWLVLIAFALVGIDESGWMPWPAAVGWIYLALPLLPAVLVVSALAMRHARHQAAA